MPVDDALFFKDYFSFQALFRAVASPDRTNGSGTNVAFGNTCVYGGVRFGLDIWLANRIELFRVSGVLQRLVTVHIFFITLQDNKP